MRVAAAIAILILGGAAPASAQRSERLFPSVADVPLVEGVVRAECPFEASRRDVRTERVCLLVDPNVGYEAAREQYRRFMVHERLWTRARADERIADVWILPSDSEIVCLSISGYLTVDDKNWLELQLFRERHKQAGLGACDWSLN